MNYFKFKSQTFAIIITLLLTSCASNNIVVKTNKSLGLKEASGFNYFKSGDYEKAFNLMKEPAAWDYKGSQYALAFMFLKGQYVEQSTLLGMGWLGVAKEANVKEWNEQYMFIYSSATDADRLKFDKIVDVYISRYGLVAQNMTCGRSTSAASRRLKIDCHKYGGTSVLYDVDLVE